MNADPERGFLRAYGALVALYPREFRDEYGADMVQLARDACRDDPTWLVAGRVLVDLAVSIPTQHLEAHVHRSPSHLVPLIYTAVAGAGIVLALAGGSNVASLFVGLLALAAAADASSHHNTAHNHPPGTGHGYDGRNRGMGALR